MCVMVTAPLAVDGPHAPASTSDLAGHVIVFTSVSETWLFCRRL